MFEELKKKGLMRINRMWQSYVFNLVLLNTVRPNRGVICFPFQAQI